MPAPLDLMVHLGVTRCKQIVEDKRVSHLTTIDDFTGCWLFTGSSNTDGYCQVWTKKNCDLNVSGRAAQTAFQLHRIALVSKTCQNIIDHASHLCDRRNCFNPDHLVDETVLVNNSRKGCPGPLYCPDHGHLVVDLCAHSPRCIRGPCEQMTCCLALRDSSSAWQTKENSQASRGDSDFGNKEEEEEREESQESRYSGAADLEEAFASGLLELPEVYDSLGDGVD